MGAINPVFVTSAAIAERGEALAKAAVDSTLLGSGQFCTKPGLFILPQSSAADFIKIAEEHLGTLAVGPLLNKAIADRYSAAIAALSKKGSVKILAGNTAETGIAVTPTFFVADWNVISSTPEFLEEHFGPTTVIAIADESEYASIASSLEGQLTATIHGTDSDDVTSLLSILADRAGRVIWNAFPTGVSVTSAMQHGGQWPSSSSHTTSVGVDAIYRFMRPVAYQGFSEANLPPALKDSNPWGVPQQIN
jgi:NADP-dependent aldehyde dehydrogenase